jgi:putative ABC transport system ATP-binding protein
LADPAVEARDLRKIYRSGPEPVEAVAGVDLVVERGTFLAIVGPSGCGKTTLLNCLSGLDEPTSGTVRVDGEAIASLDDDARTRARAERMGFVFQSTNLLPALTARENAELPLLLDGADPAEAADRAREALADVGLADRADHRPGELSGGQRQRVALARSLVNDPAIVWADEPTGDLDGETARDVLDLLGELHASQDLTIVAVTHDPALSKRADRVVEMEAGQLVGGRGGR